MTEDEIKERKEYLRSTVSMYEVLNRYGIKIKWSRCRGFCHDGKDFNMKVFRTGCHCFVCSKSYDIFDVTMILNNCDFWTAFELLGGTEKQSFTTSRKAKQAVRDREQRIAWQRKEELKLRRIRMYITAYRRIITTEEPFSDLWCYAQNKLPYQLYLLEIYSERG
ncbi:MAG: zinc finger CHC2-family protein [Herbinix sp.]|nr:zinc finger CHC2-family protein [Herbinix sp.]